MRDVEASIIIAAATTEPIPRASAEVRVESMRLRQRVKATDPAWLQQDVAACRLLMNEFSNGWLDPHRATSVFEEQRPRSSTVPAELQWLIPRRRREPDRRLGRMFKNSALTRRGLIG